MPDISICICTFQRPELLRHLLTAIFYQQLEALSIQVVVVDNDPLQSAAQVLSKQKELFGDRLVLASHGVANISLARNASIRAASGNWIVLVDDDEIPNADWLQQLISTQKNFSADVVFAPVLPAYVKAVPEWIREGAYFERRRLATGTSIDHRDARSGNVLIRKSVLERVVGPFDPAFGTTGGEDSMLFRHLGAAGAKMVWCDEAPVFELIPAERARPAWLLRRSFRTGQLFMRTELSMLNGRARTARAAYLGARAALQMLLAAAFSIALAPLKPLSAFKWLRIASSQMGKISYLFGHNSHAYGESC